MPVEGATYISQLDATLPAGNQPRSEGDNHLRLLKSVLKATFPNVTGPVSATHTVLNGLNDRVATLEGKALQTAADGTYSFSDKLLTNVGYPTAIGKQGASTKWVSDYLLGVMSSVFYPVGSLYITLNPGNPSLYFGFGTWVAYGTGYALVSAGTGTDGLGVSQNFPANTVVGEYRHTLTTGEIPAHQHGMTNNLNNNNTAVQAGGGVAVAASAENSGATDFAGGSGSHNNIQPSIGVYVWVRTA